MPYVQDDEEIILGRVLLKMGDLDAAQEVVDAALSGSRRSGRVRATNEALVLEALIKQALGQVDQLPDQAALYGLLSRLRDLSLPLLSVERPDLANEDDQS